MRSSFEQTCETMALLFEDMWQARGGQVVPFPARRHDEKGWFIGHVLNGTTLTDQRHVEVPWESWEFPEDYLRTLVDGIPEKASISAMPPLVAPADWQSHYVLTPHFHLRCILIPNSQAIRLDVVVG